MEFQDYYQILKVSKSATAEEIQKAYRKQARQYHPDVNKAKGAEDQFKKISEAYEVLKNPESRQKYDALGQNWKSEQPKGWQNVDFNFGKQSQSGFSDFFDMIFGQNASRERRPVERDVEVTISLEEAYSGITKTIAPFGVQVKIPAGATTGARLRLREQGLVVNIHVAAHKVFRVEGHDLIRQLNISPWEAVLGASVDVQTLSGNLRVKIPAASQSGNVLRLKGKGLVVQRKTPGDLRIELQIKVPTKPGDDEIELFKKLANISKFNPR